jgi:hypothetical protein
MKTYNNRYRLKGNSLCKDYSACASFSAQNGRLSGGVMLAIARSHKSRGEVSRIAGQDWKMRPKRL